MRVAVTSMQGWRKTMEDEHFVELNLEPGIHIFGVFDGHGGREVATFAKDYFVENLVISPDWHRRDYKRALINTFLKMDRLMRSKNGQKEIINLIQDNMNNKLINPGDAYATID